MVAQVVDALVPQQSGLVLSLALVRVTGSPRPVAAPVTLTVGSFTVSVGPSGDLSCSCPRAPEAPCCPHLKAAKALGLVEIAPILGPDTALAVVPAWVVGAPVPACAVAVPSATAKGRLWVVSPGGCACPAGQVGKPCWHVAAVRSIIPALAPPPPRAAPLTEARKVEPKVVEAKVEPKVEPKPKVTSAPDPAKPPKRPPARPLPTPPLGGAEGRPAHPIPPSPVRPVQPVRPVASASSPLTLESFFADQPRGYPCRVP